MVIEDDEVAAEIFQVFLRQHEPDADLAWCWNGYEALVRVPEFKPDLILLDYMMPRLDGLEFLRMLRELDDVHSMYIAVISAYVEEDRHKTFLEAGADVVLNKPVTTVQMKELAEKAKAGRKKKNSKPKA